MYLLVVYRHVAASLSGLPQFFCKKLRLRFTGCRCSSAKSKFFCDIFHFCTSLYSAFFPKNTAFQDTLFSSLKPKILSHSIFCFNHRFIISGLLPHFYHSLRFFYKIAHTVCCLYFLLHIGVNIFSCHSIC